MTLFSQTLWQDNAALYGATLHMPFNRELAAGTLPLPVFQHYIVQDAHYLEGFGRTLALAAARARTAEQIALLAQGAETAIVVERALHGHYFALFGLSPESVASTPPTPVCDHYVSFLLRTAATEDFPVTIAAVLPCFWIYREVGVAIHREAASEHPFRAWIDTYAGEDFDRAVSAMIDLTDQLAAGASADQRARMARAYAHSALLEWMFWDSAHHQRGWPRPEGPR